MRAFQLGLTMVAGWLFSQWVFASGLPDFSMLSQDNAWQQLGHYHRTFSGWQSQVDDAEFFLAPEGASNPEAELRATWQALQTALQTPLSEAADIRCQWPARVHWLERRLSLDIPTRSCPEMDRWLAAVSAYTMTLVFPGGYMNSPSSMFGHTLLRLDAQDRSRNPDLTAYAVNFAANVAADQQDALYAIKGIFGAYGGFFSLMPYYKKVNEYNDLESRDLWEYRLKLSPEMLQRVLWHLWELNDIRFDYWFFDENCSYQLLALLSVARDDLNLTQGFDLYAIPVDTIRRLREEDLLGKVHYRPSFATRLNAMSEQMTTEAVSVANQLAQPQAPTTPVDHLKRDRQKAEALELAYEWMNFRFQHQPLPREEAAPQLRRLLLARARVPGGSPFNAVKPPDVTPDEGHASSRWTVGAGHYEDETYLNLKVRPSYHDMLDDAAGYLPTAELNFLELDMRYWTEDDRLEPWRLTVMELANYAPRTPIFKPLAWRLKIDGEQVGAPGEGYWRGRFTVDAGQVVGHMNGLYGFAFAGVEAQAGHASGGLDQPEHDQAWGLAPSVSVGGGWQPLDRLRLRLETRWLPFVSGNQGEVFQSQVGANWRLTREQAIRLEWQAEHRAQGKTRDDIRISWLHYF